MPPIHSRETDPTIRNILKENPDLAAIYGATATHEEGHNLLQQIAEVSSAITEQQPSRELPDRITA